MISTAEHGAGLQIDDAAELFRTPTTLKVSTLALTR